MSEGSSSGGRGPSSIKPPTIKPPTARGEQFGATTLGAAPEPVIYDSSPSRSVGAMPPAYAASPPAYAPPRKQNLLLWVVVAALLLGFFVLVLGVLAYVLLR
ncbi:MAG TPA: hypothetical protein VF553_02800 [Pyrinomonadaceae bacterium]